MRTIEIDTTQNVTIQYELATVGERIAAFLVDLAILGVTFCILFLFIGISGSQKTATYIMYLVIAPIFIFYSLACECWLNGQSIGKKIMRLKVIKLSGKEATLSDYLLRWSFRMVDIYFSLGAIASIFINSTRQAQRLGDVVANTTIVRLRPKTVLDLNDILKIQTRAGYTPTFYQVTQLSENDLLTVKKTLDRYKSFPNAAHTKAVLGLTDILCERLKLNEKPKDKLAFLKTLINDYVVLTR